MLARRCVASPGARLQTRLLILLGSLCHALESPAWYTGVLEDGADLDDVAQSCDVDAVQGANMAQLHPILKDLCETTFFRIFHVNLKNPECPFWKKETKDSSESEDHNEPSCAGAASPTSPFALPVSGGGFGEMSLNEPHPPPCSVDGEEMAAAPVPTTIFLKSPSGFEEFSGSFELVQGRSVHDLPVWTSSGGQLLHADNRGHWMVSANEAALANNAGVMSTIGPHGGTWPHQHDQWATTDGGVWREHKDIVLFDGSADLEIDLSMTLAEELSERTRENENETSCEIEEDLPLYWSDMCDSPNDAGVEAVNMVKNPERNTGYNGSHIWEAMYNENCLEVGNNLARGRAGTAANMCYEERVLYRLLSGWHASTTIAIAKNFYAPGTKLKNKWAPNPQKYVDSYLGKPERVKNLHFSFVVMLRAIKKASPFLRSYSYSTGDGTDEKSIRGLMGHLLDSEVLSLCSPLFDAFDETMLFRTSLAEERRVLKRQFKNVFKNITVLVDCVQCQRCRLHAKLYSLGLGTALKILLTPPDLIPSTLKRDEIVAIVWVLWKLSESMEDARVLARAYYKQQGLDSEVRLPQPPAEQPPGAPEQGILRPVSKDREAPQPSEAQLPPQPSALDADLRLRLLDVALGAVRSGALPETDELAILRSLFVAPRDEVLLLAKHFGDKPQVFNTIALEAAARTEPVQVRAAMSSSVVGANAFPELPDAVIIGGGLAGMTAALSIIDRGGSVALLDKQAFMGGNSGKASSGLNSAMETSVDSLIADTTKSAKHLARANLIQKLANDSKAAATWLMTRTGVDLSMRSQLGGHSVKRTLRPSNGFVGFAVTQAIGEELKKLAKERPDRLQLNMKCKWTGLKRDGDLWQVLAERSGTQVVFKSPHVVISSGGFGRDKDEADSLMRKHRPDLAEYSATLGPQTTGDGVKIARDVGAKLVDLDRVQLHPTGFVDPKNPDDRTKTLAAELLRGVGGLIFDKTGLRFTDELGTRQAVVNGMLKRAGEGVKEVDRTFFLVLNSKAAAVADRHRDLYTAKGLLTKVSGVSKLAEFTNMSQISLTKTMQAYNVAAEKGQDEFGRSVFPAHVPIDLTEDFFVGQVTPVIHYTMGGIAIDTEARVLSASDEAPIPGLFAIGEASGGVHGDNRLAGNSLLECLVFGRQVGTAMPILAGTATRPQAVERPAVAEEPASDQGQLREITAEELAAHKSDVWVALYGHVYDFSAYAEEHPGGEEAVHDVAGIDGTVKFEAVHNRDVLEKMGFQPIGRFR